jgi:hypothetical protein
MTLVYFIFAVISITIGHIAKIYRWELFISTYEPPQRGNLLRAFALSGILNTLLPFRLGEVVRAFFSGRKMKNGIAFSLATVFVDRYLDIVIVGLVIIILFIKEMFSNTIFYSVIFYMILSLSLLVLIVIAVKYNTFFKKTIKVFASVFNQKIKLKIFMFGWSFIISFKDIAYKINKIKFVASTIIVWSGYLLSYLFFSYFISANEGFFTFQDIFLFSFSGENFKRPIIRLLYANPNTMPSYFCLYTTISLVLIFFASFFFSGYKKLSQWQSSNYRTVLPQANEKDQFSFLEAYFSGDRREFLKNYITLNQDVSIVRDYSSGSMATTLLCLNADGMFYRKYEFGAGASKLSQQIEWIESYQGRGSLPLPRILRKSNNSQYCCYDMEYNMAAVNFFNYIHTVKTDKSWEILYGVLKQLEESVYTVNPRNADVVTVKEYIEKKVVENLQLILNSKEIKPLMQYKKLMINNVEYDNLNNLQMYFQSDYLFNIFKNDTYSDIHGDLTIENIIAIQTDNSFYLIDPYVGGVHDSPNLDYAKILQSLHHGYEFYKQTSYQYNVEKSKISFMSSYSRAYDKLYSRYIDYLKQKFSFEQVRSIYFHEIVHWLRLIPYKIKKGGPDVKLFYSLLLIVVNDIIDTYGRNPHS